MLDLLDKRIGLKIAMGIIVFDVASLVVYTIPVLLWPVTVLGLCGYVVWSVKNPQALIVIPLAELVYGSFGRHFVWDLYGSNVTLRMALLACSIVLAFYHARMIRWNKGDLSNSIVLFMFMLAAVVLFSIIRSLLNHVPVGNMIADANAYGYGLYCIVWYIVFKQRPDALTYALSTVVSTAMMLSLKTLFLFHLFSVHYEWANVTYLYLWLRDTRVAELTAVGPGVWRIFMQSQVFIGVVLLWFIVSIKYPMRWSFMFLSSIFFAALIASQSRSYWISFICSAMIIVALMIMSRNWRRIRGLTVAIASSVALAISILGMLIFIPYGVRPSIDSLSARMSASDPAGISRMQQLDPLFKAIKRHPLIGSGFGSTVTYASSDPRIKSAANPTGTVTTYAFEWGYLDMFYKWGLIGMLVFGGYLVYLFYALIRARTTIAVSMAIGLLFIIVTHMFSPYLNHPLGLGYLALSAIIAKKSS